MSKETAAVDPLEFAVITVKRVDGGRWKVKAIMQKDGTAEQTFGLTINPRSPQAWAFTEALSGLEALAAEQGED